MDTVNSFMMLGSEQDELQKNGSAKVMKDTSVNFGRFVKITDLSPVTIVVNTSEGNSQTMEVDISKIGNDSGNSDNAEATDSTTSTENTNVASQEKLITIGEKIETTNFDFTLKNVEFSYDVKPQDTSSVYTSYEAPDGKVYIHINGDYYNKAKKDVCVRDLFVPSVDYNNGYKYEGFAAVDSGNSFTWGSSYVVCTPLETCNYHGLVQCPVEVESSSNPLFVTFVIDGTTYRYNIR